MEYDSQYSDAELIPLLDDVEQSYFSTLTPQERAFLLNKKRHYTYYYHRDHQGSIIALSDAEGEIVERLTYDGSYGIITEHTKSVETFNPYGYTGREVDAHDLYYYRARYYDPNIGRFLSEDPLEFLSGDTNFYRYVESDPVNFVDPFGLSKCNQKKKRLAKAAQKSQRVTKTVAQKTAKSVARKAVALTAVVADGPLPIGDIIAAGLMVWDVVDMWDTGSDLAEAAQDLADASDSFDRCKEKEAKEKKADASGKKDGAKISGRKLKKKKVKCFCPKDSAKGGRNEYDRQLKAQQDGINDLSVEKYIKNREAFSGKKICGKKDKLGNPTENTQAGKTSKRDPKITKQAKKDRLTTQQEKYTDEFLKKGNSPKKAKKLGNAKAKRELSDQHALHNADMVADGDDRIIMNDLGFGEGAVNTHIGSQWKGDRIRDMDMSACEAKKQGKEKEKMNVELRACGKKEAKKTCKKKK